MTKETLQSKHNRRLTIELQHVLDRMTELARGTDTKRQLKHLAHAQNASYR